MGSSTKGFASNSPVQQRFVSAKGGRKKVPKGLKQMTPEKAREIRRLGGLARQKQIKEEKNGKDSISSGDRSHTEEVS